MKFRMNNSKPLSTPMVPHDNLSTEDSPTTPAGKVAMIAVPYREAEGSLLYLSQCTRLDLAASVGKFMSNPGPKYWELVKRILHCPRD